MGAWGEGVLENDLSADVYDDYLEALDQGDSPHRANLVVQEAYGACLSDPHNTADFWLGLAFAQMDRDCLQPTVLAQVEEIVTQELGQERWKEDPETWAVRKGALDAFLEKLQGLTPLHDRELNLPTPRPWWRRMFG